jgi:hypothetical protein
MTINSNNYFISTQEHTSANTSINSSKLPKIYNRINWHLLSENYKPKFGKKIKVLDYGCGKYTKHIEDFLAQFNIEYYGFDPYNKSREENIKANKNFPYDIIICSNVFNILDSKEEIEKLQLLFYESSLFHETMYFATVYEGNKSGVGKTSKKDCWQRNEPTKSYLGYGPNGLEVFNTVKKDVLTRNEWIEFIL